MSAIGARTALPPRGAGAAWMALLALLCWAPVPLGSNRPWSAALLAAGLLAVGFALALANLDRPASLWSRLAPAALPASLLAGWAAFAFVQIVPLPAAVLGVLSPAARDAWREVGVTLAPISLDAGATLAAALRAAALAVTFAVATVVLSTRRRVHVACAVIVALGVGQALLGIAAALGRAAGWVPGGPIEGVGGASGTFVNPNHFAGLLEVALALSVGLSVALRDPAPMPRDGRSAALGIIEFALSPRRLLLGGAQVVLVVGLLWSGSRGALLAVAVALAGTMLLLPSSPNARPAQRARTLAGVTAAAVIGVLWMGSGSLGDKLSSAGLASNRLALAAASVAMIADFPLTGAGAGAFRAVFPAYKTPDLGLSFYEHAHNDYLEIAAESGLLGLGLFAGAIGASLALTAARARVRHSREARGIAAGSVAGAVALLVHGLYDFNLQIPANAALFVFVVALAAAAAGLPDARDAHAHAEG